MLYFPRTIVKPEIPIIGPTGKEAAHALVRLVESGVRIALRLRTLPHLPDRKSTRLNSSHLGISYAVFCLKKKNNNYRLLMARSESSGAPPSPQLPRCA